MVSSLGSNAQFERDAFLNADGNQVPPVENRGSFGLDYSYLPIMNGLRELPSRGTSLMEFDGS